MGESRRIERLRARRLETSDLKEILSWYSDPAVLAVMEDERLHPAMLRRKLKGLVRSNPVEDCEFALVIELGGECIAFAQLMWINWIGRTAELDFMFNPRHHGSRFLLLAVFRTLEELFVRDFNLHKVYSFVYASNVRALALFRRLMHEEAVLRKYLKRDGAGQDVHVLGLTAEDFRTELRWRKDDDSGAVSNA